MSLSLEDQDRIMPIFFPYADLETRKVISSGGRFVYYTTAETATCILRSKQFWMRNTAAMNDYLEVEHGFDCLNASYKASPGMAFNAALDTCFSGLADEVKDFFNGWLPSIRRDTYITCMSEHLRGEDQHGRLSMWRAYGEKTGVALVLNAAVMVARSAEPVLNIFTSPVAYLNPDDFGVEVGKIAKNIVTEVGYIRSLGREQVKNVVFNMLRFAVLCTKHPGFHEEREWRVIASPVMHPTQHANFSVEVIRGTPQEVLRVDFKNHPGLVGLALPELLDRIIIGPCQFPDIVRGAFYRLLEEAGVTEVKKKVIVSDIPLRQP